MERTAEVSLLDETCSECGFRIKDCEDLLVNKKIELKKIKKKKVSFAYQLFSILIQAKAKESTVENFVLVYYQSFGNFLDHKRSPNYTSWIFT